MPDLNPNAGLEGVGLLLRGQQQQNAQENHDREAPQREVEQRMQQARLDRLRTDLTAEDLIRQRDLKNFTTADTALRAYDTERGRLAADDPARFQRLDQLKAKYLPEIGRHPAVIQQFQAYNTADQANEAWVQYDRMKTQLAGFNSQALDLGLGPQVFAIQNGVKAGEKSLADALTEVSGLVRTRKDERDVLAQKRSLELRDASATGRSRGHPAASGAAPPAMPMSGPFSSPAPEAPAPVKPAASIPSAALATQSAWAAIQQGADPAAVRARYHRLYGTGLPDFAGEEGHQP